ncbi:uncharacterized protein LOC131369778 [Hemibagrus wyckioides]|uniref:uncharacterized protein LOC131369778 n=1 Tax=Hemibagrus wyckioides TaxID=337641 RepID=UPI00266D52A7|nr:uncharacterized protein LOC131369778 [Hemibagrus wyckioides]
MGCSYHWREDRICLSQNKQIKLGSCKGDGQRCFADKIRWSGRDSSWKHSTRRQLVNILVAHMIEKHGRIPTRSQMEKYALGIVMLFPSLKDPFSPKGYEHFYDAKKGTGFLAWRLKTSTRNRGQRPASPPSASSPEQGPKRRRHAAATVTQLEGDACKEAIAFLVHASDEASVFHKMKETFKQVFPRFLDVKGLLNSLKMLKLTGTVIWPPCCCFSISCHLQLDAEGSK